MNKSECNSQSYLNLGTTAYATSNRLRAMACGERPQQRLDVFGVSSLSDTELIALLLGSGTRGHDVMTVASALIHDAGSIAKLARLTESDFRRIKGIGKIKAQRLMAIMEIARRAIIDRSEAAPILSQAERVAEFLQPHCAGLEVEKFWVLCLNRKNRLIKLVEVTSGTATNALVHCREVFRPVIKEGATALICAHNHPSGDCAPSSADIQITRVLKEGAKTLCIEFLDHVIVGSPSGDPTGKGFYSFRQSGLV